MFDQLFTSSRTVERYSNSPLLEERLRYLAQCAAQGSTRSSLRLIAQHQVVLVDYLRLQTTNSITVEQIQAAAAFGAIGKMSCDLLIRLAVKVHQKLGIAQGGVAIRGHGPNLSDGVLDDLLCNFHGIKRQEACDLPRERHPFGKVFVAS